MTISEKAYLFRDHKMASGPSNWYRHEQKSQMSARAVRKFNICISYVFAYYQFKNDLDNDRPKLISTKEQRAAIRKGAGMDVIEDDGLYVGDLKAHGDALGDGSGSPRGLGLKSGWEPAGYLSLNRENLLRCVDHLLGGWNSETPRLFHKQFCGVLLMMFSDYGEIVGAVGNKLISNSATRDLIDAAIQRESDIINVTNL